MQPADKINALAGVFNWSWWQIFLLTFFVDWFLIQIVIKRFEPLGWGPPLGKSERTYYWSAIYGDLFLPFAIASSVIVLRNFEFTDSWYTSRVWNWIVLGIGAVIILAIEASIKITQKQRLMPSKIWHTAIFPPMFYLGVITIIPLFVSHKPIWAFVIAIFSYIGWFVMVVHDAISPPDVSRTH